MGIVQTKPETRRFLCDWVGCSKSFKRKYDMERHHRIHTNDRPFACTMPGCYKTFVQRSALTVHCRTHTGEKPYACDNEACNKRFSDCSSRARHVRMFCSRRFYKKPSDFNYEHWMHNNQQQKNTYTTPSRLEGTGKTVAEDPMGLDLLEDVNNWHVIPPWKVYLVMLNLSYRFEEGNTNYAPTELHTNGYDHIDVYDPLKWHNGFQNMRPEKISSYSQVVGGDKSQTISDLDWAASYQTGIQMVQLYSQHTLYETVHNSTDSVLLQNTPIFVPESLYTIYSSGTPIYTVPTSYATKEYSCVGSQSEQTDIWQYLY